MNKRNTMKANFPWTFFCTGVVLLVLSLLFKAYDMAVVSCIPVIGSFGLFAYSCYLDKKTKREISVHKAFLREEGMRRVERDCRHLDMLDEQDRNNHSITQS